MRRAFWTLLVGCLLSAPLYGQGYGPTCGYFFPPPKTLLFNRPGLLFQGYPGYRFQRSRHSYYGRYYPKQSYPWRTSYRRPRSNAGHGNGVYSYRVPAPRSGIIQRANSGDVRFHVTPGNALVFIDDKLIGSADDFSRTRDAYVLISGEYDLRIEHPDYQPFQSVLTISPDRSINLNIRLEPVTGE